MPPADCVQRADCQHVGEHRRATVGNERQRQPGHRKHADGHGDLNAGTLTSSPTNVVPVSAQTIGPTTTTLVTPAVRLTGRTVRLPGTRTSTGEPATYTRPDASTASPGTAAASGFQAVGTAAVSLPVPGSTRTRPAAVSTHTTRRPGAICGRYSPGSTGTRRTTISDLGSIRLMPATPPHPTQTPRGPGKAAQPGPAPGIGATLTITSRAGSILYRCSSARPFRRPSAITQPDPSPQATPVASPRTGTRPAPR